MPSTGPSAEKDTSEQGKKVLGALSLWMVENQQQAVEAIMSVDWRCEVSFADRHHLFTMAEKKYLSLEAGEREKVFDEIFKQFGASRALARKLVESGAQARTAKQPDKAEKYFTAAIGLGGTLDHDPEQMLIVRMVGIAIQKLAIPPLQDLYKEQGQAEKVKDLQDRSSRLDEEHAKIRQEVSATH